MQVGAAVIDCLASNGIDTLFGIPGKQTLPLNKAIEERNDIRFVMARHETAVSHNAWGYAESSGRMAATVVIPGPGDLNASNGLKNALNDCTPLLHVSVETEPEIRGGDGIHETPPDTYDNVVKENILVETPSSTVAEVQRAIELARSPPMGPVRIGIPKNFLGMDVSLATATSTDRGAPESPPAAAIDQAADLLAEADAPIVIAGGGVRSSDASASLRAIAERLAAPVVTSYKGKGTFPEDHELSAGVICGGSSPALIDLIEGADVTLAVGTDFDAVWTRAWSIDVSSPLIHVTMHPADIGTGYEPTVGLVADADAVLTAIDGALADRSIGKGNDRGGGASRAEEVRTADADRMAELRAVDDPPLTSVSALAAVRRGVPRETIVTADAGGSRLWTLVSFPVYDPRDYVNPGSWASMGTGLPAAIGAACANPDRSVVSLAGEGGLMMAIHELHTIVAEDLDVTVVVMNNNDYAIISEEAARSYHLEENAYGWTMSPISISTIAEGMGLDAERAETPAAVEETVAAAVDREGPALVEIPTDPNEPQAGVWMRG